MQSTFRREKRRPSLFDILPGELVDIADYAFEIHKREKRAPKLAVNASSWWYVNLTTATVQEIRKRSGPDDNPIERNILLFTLQILSLGFQLHFVFDGTKRLSNSRKLYPGRDPPSELFKDVLTKIGVPWHEAPDAAEAECAKMEMERVVDAVWSEDGDALALGCRTLIKSFFKIQSSTAESEKRNKSYAQFTVYNMEKLAGEHPGMDREGFVLNAIFNRMSKNPDEQSYLAPDDVLEAAERGLAKSLCAASGSSKELRQWAKTEFSDYLQSPEIPLDFPRRQHVQDYLKPIVSSREVFLNFQKAREPFDNEDALFSFLTDRLQMTLNQWVKYVLPYRVVRSLLATEEGSESQHDHLKLKCNDILKRKKGQLPQKVVAEFKLCEATSLNVATLHMETGEVETMLWILRRANFNQTPSLKTFFTPSQKGKGIAPGSMPERPRQRHIPEAEMAIATPSSAPASNPNGEVQTGEPSNSRPQKSPPSPTPASRKRKRHIPRQVSKRFSKTTCPPSRTMDSGKAVEKDTGDRDSLMMTPPMSYLYDAETPERHARASSADKKQPLDANLLLTPMDQIADRADAGDGYIVIDSD
ncbi:PIN domain-like protein [Mollisia scopiformis]|uniref:PIN domain-like protein n=1 Tax=Mollisia scopiformis TaxID=149040 RepID=A0A194XE84_MOLSC|nr:PIN domain-like protein [Mollisia scopiformis]KUJ18072.1 PIN domain-like protein [Mollisia scopiformis]